MIHRIVAKLHNILDLQIYILAFRSISRVDSGLIGANLVGDDLYGSRMLFIFCYVLPFEHGFCCLSHGQLAFHDDLLVDDLDEIVTNIILLEDFDEVLELDVIAVGVLV